MYIGFQNMLLCYFADYFEIRYLKTSEYNQRLSLPHLSFQRQNHLKKFLSGPKCLLEFHLLGILPWRGALQLAPTYRSALLSIFRLLTLQWGRQDFAFIVTIKACFQVLAVKSFLSPALLGDFHDLILDNEMSLQMELIHRHWVFLTAVWLFLCQIIFT